MKTPRARLAANQIDKVAELAGADARTVRRVLLGETVRPLARRRIEAALRACGAAFPAPEAESMPPAVVHIDEERIRAIVREELAAANVTRPAGGWLTPPKAARAFSVSLKRIRFLVAGGTVVTRLRNIGPVTEKTQRKIEVSIDSLDAALSGGYYRSEETLQQRAARILQRARQADRRP